MYGIVLSPKYGTLSAEPCALFFMPLRCLDDQSRELSDQMVGASRNELDVILPKLLAAIHEKMEGLRSLAGGIHPSERLAFPP